MTGQPIHIVFGGLPGTGKTTLSRALTRGLAASHIRVGAIEHLVEWTELYLRDAIE